MPELPEVETFVRSLQPRLPGRRVTHTRLRHADLYRRGSLRLTSLVGRIVERVERVGKNIVIRFHPGGVMLVNLGMTGRLVAWPGEGGADDVHGGKHLHVRIRFADDGELRYYDARRFGHFYVAEKCNFEQLGIGPDPFLLKPRGLQAALSGRSASVKSLLLNQRVVSGIGNIYADETLFCAGIHPARSGDYAAPQAAALLRHSRVVLRRAIEHGGSTLRDYRRPDGTPGGYQSHHAVYGRAGLPCLRCGTSIERIVLAGRGTHFCPRCQR